MRKRKVKTMYLLLTMSLFTWNWTARAEQGQALLEIITDRQGLSQNIVYTIIQDSKGFMWIGTKGGLNRYDGYSFKIYKHEHHDPNSLSSNWIYTIYEDSKGILWIGTLDGLDRFDPETEKFTRYRHDPEDLNSLAHNRVRVIYEDSFGYVWIGTEDGLDLFDREKGTFTHYRHDPDDPNSVIHNWVYTIHEDSSGFLWIGTQGGISRFDRVKKVFKHYRHDPRDPNSLSHDRVYVIYEDSRGMLWICTRCGLNRLDRESENFTRYVHNSRDPNSLSSNVIRSICEDRFGVLWIATDGGLNRFDREKGTFTYYSNNLDDPNSLNLRVIYQICEDMTGILWLGTIGGVIKFDRKKQVFRHYRHNPDVSNSLGHDMVNTIYEDSSGDVWIGTGNGLDKFDRDKGTFIHYIHDAVDFQSMNISGVVAIHEDRFGKIWIGTIGGGLSKMDTEGQFIYYTHDPSDPRSLSHDYVYSIYEDRFGTLWIGTWGGGLNRFDRKTETFTHYRYDPNNPNSLGDDRVRLVYEDREGTLWIGTNIQGLDKFDRKTETFIHYRHDPNDPSTLSDNRILTIYEDKASRLWIGTVNGGLNQWNRETETFVYYTSNDGLSGDRINGILEDDSGHLWLSTNNGLTKFDPHTETFRNYDVHDGIRIRRLRSGACCRARGGEMFFGGEGGYTVFCPDQIKDNFCPPTVVFTGFKIFNREVKLDKSVSRVKRIELSYKDSFFSFEFAALDYSTPHKNQYAYKMEGFDKDWIYCGTRRFVSYTNLNPGDYTFKVKGSNNDGIWSREEVSMKVTITPPFWKTWWFRIVAIFTVSFFIFIAYQIRMYSIKRRNRELEEINRALNNQITVRKKVENALRESEERLSAFMDSAPESFTLFDSELNFVDINEATSSYLPTGIQKEDIIGKHITEIIPDIKEKGTYDRYVEVIKTGKPFFFNDFVPHPQSGNRYLAVRAFRVGDGLGVIGEDITERIEAEEAIKASLKEKEVLLREIHHRVKNNLQVISSLLNLQSRLIEDKKALHMFRDSQDRVRSMAMVHEKLYQSQDLAKVDFAGYIKSLTNSLYRSYSVNPERVRLELEVMDIFLSINLAVPCGLIINELVSNALKHAFPPKWKGSGKIGISFLRIEDSEIELSVCDNGVGLPENIDLKHSESFGLHLVTLLVRDQLQGEITLDRNGGTKFQMRFKGLEV